MYLNYLYTLLKNVLNRIIVSNPNETTIHNILSIINQICSSIPPQILFPNLFVLQSLNDSKIPNLFLKALTPKSYGRITPFDGVRGCQVPIFPFTASHVEYLSLGRAPGIKVQSFLHESCFFFFFFFSLILRL